MNNWCICWFFTHIFYWGFKLLKGSLRDVFISRSALKGWSSRHPSLERFTPQTATSHCQQHKAPWPTNSSGCKSLTSLVHGNQCQCRHALSRSTVAVEKHRFGSHSGDGLWLWPCRILNATPKGRPSCLNSPQHLGYVVTLCVSIP
jgi:hypothetical protein